MEALRQPETRLKDFLPPSGSASRAKRFANPHRVGAAALRHRTRTTGHRVYANDNPVRFTDPDGRQSVGYLWDNSPVVLQERRNDAAVAAGELQASQRAVAFGVGFAKGYARSISRDGPGAVLSGVGVGAGLVSAARAMKGVAPVAKEITLSVKAQGEAAVHAADAIRAGKPDILTVAKGGASANRKAALGGMQKVPGKQLDEYPPAMFKEGGSGASVRAINPADNMSAGACLGNACRGLSNGERVKIRIEE